MLTTRELRELRSDIEDRDNNSGAPYWTERVGALLDHVAQLDKIINPRLPGF